MPRPSRILKKVKEGDTWQDKNSGELVKIEKILHRTRGGVTRYRINLTGSNRRSQVNLYELWKWFEKVE